MNLDKSDNHKTNVAVPNAPAPMAPPRSSADAAQPQTLNRHSSRLFSQNTLLGVVILDYFNVVVFLTLAQLVRFETPMQKLGVHTYTAPLGGMHYPLNYFFAGAALLILSFWHNNLYRTHNLLRFRSCIRPILAGMLYGIMGAVVLVYFFKIGEQISRLYILIAPIIVSIGFLSWRWWLSRFLHSRQIIQHLSERILFVGWTDEAQKLYETICSDTGQPYDVVGYLPSPHHTFQVEPPMDLPFLGDYNNLRQILRDNAIEIVVLADLNPNVGEILGLANACEKEMVQFKIIPSFFRILLSGLDLETISGVPILGVARLPLDYAFNRLVKRLVDIVGAIVGLILFSPAMVIFGVLVHLESPGPIIYRQRRVGRNGSIFYIYKIRSMKIDADKGGDRWTTKDDPRRLRVGVFMRAWNIDELPQFWNVLKGNMSLVGPRPETADLTQIFKEEIPHYNARHGIKPGITGWAQVNGLRGNTDLGERIRYDLYYLENWSIWLDFQIMAQTFISRKNAY